MCPKSGSIIYRGQINHSWHLWAYPASRLDIIEEILDELVPHLATTGHYHWDSGHMRAYINTAMLAVERGRPKPKLPYPIRIHGNRANIGELV